MLDTGAGSSGSSSVLTPALPGVPVAGVALCHETADARFARRGEERRRTRGEEAVRLREAAIEVLEVAQSAECRGLVDDHVGLGVEDGAANRVPVEDVERDGLGPELVQALGPLTGSRCPDHLVAPI